MSVQYEKRRNGPNTVKCKTAKLPHHFLLSTSEKDFIQFDKEMHCSYRCGRLLLVRRNLSAQKNHGFGNLKKNTYFTINNPFHYEKIIIFRD